MQDKINDYKTYGAFTPDGREFIITKMDTPRPWLNYAWTPSFVCKIDQRGRGETIYRSANGERTQIVDDRIVYIKDKNSGEFWTVGWDPVRLEGAPYVCAHGLGYSRLDLEHRGIRSEWYLSAFPDRPAEFWTITVSNTSADTKFIDVVPFASMPLGGWEPYGSIEMFSAGVCESHTIYALNTSNERPNVANSGFITVDCEPEQAIVSKREFVGGAYGSLSNPAALREDGAYLDRTSNEPVGAAFIIPVELAPGEIRTISIVIGSCESMEDGKALSDRCLREGEIETAIERVQQRQRIFSNVEIELPDGYWTTFYNIWLKQQLMLQTDYARLAMMGYRDTLQDAHTLCPYDPKRARQAIVMALKHQYADGSCLRAWWPLDHHKYADSGVWIVFTLAEYIKETGDRTIVDEVVPFFDEGDATVWEHLERALDWIYANPGRHELCRVGFGDWNDSLGIGRKGEGESVWLTMAYLAALKECGALAETLDRPNTVSRYSATIERISDALEKDCWDGQWYNRGFTDEGEVVGAESCDEGQIYINPQSWAVIAGVCDAERQDVMEQQVRKRLKTDYGYRVLAPAYTHYREAFGRITTCAPGWAENGSCYCHVTAFKSVADCMRRDGNAAVESLAGIMPGEITIPVEQHGAEPYVSTNMFCAPEHSRPGWSIRGWLTGAGSWMLRCMTHWVLGVRPDHDGLIIDPVFPDGWSQASMVRKFRNADYTISFKKTVTHQTAPATISIDGVELAGNKIPYNKYNGKHMVSAVIKK